MAQPQSAPERTRASTNRPNLALPSTLADPVSVVAWEPIDLRKALVVVAFPGVGLASSIAATYLVDSLRLREVGGLLGSSFPPSAIVQGGVGSPPVRLFIGKVTCGPDGRCEQLCVIQSTMAPKPSMLTPIALAIVAWAKEHGAEHVVCLDGVKRESGLEGEAQVFGVASDPEGRKMLDHLNVPPYTDGILVGIGGVALYAARALHQPALSLLVESRESLPDARGAARLLETLRPLVPLVNIDERPLIEQAGIIEAVFREQKAKSSRAQKELAQASDVMFG